ncbi:MAG: cation transporter [Planctomycetota bacterium]
MKTMKSVTLYVEGMSCEHCVNTIQSTLKNLNVIGKVHLENKTVQLDFDENEVSLESIRKVIENQGYEVQ